MAAFFLGGSLCFVVGPFPGYAGLVGDAADAVTFFVGSILFTLGGSVQAWMAWRERRSADGGRSAWWVAMVQFVGTLFFNVTTFRAMHTALSSSEYNQLVWRPDALGSICFLISGGIAYHASPRRGWLPVCGGAGWWETSVNGIGCVLFGVSAVAGHVVPTTGAMLDQAAANWTTSLGAACFLACSVFTLLTGGTSKSGRFRRVRRFADVVERDAGRLVPGRRRAPSG